MTNRGLAALAAFWVLGLAGGGYAAYAYMTTPGELAGAPARWPEHSTLPRVGTTVVMFVSLDCPCSRASLVELAKVHAAARTLVVAEHVPDDPRFTWVADPDGVEAARFGAQTSGFTVVYDAAGALRFAGGITGARGHEGDNVGRARLEQAIAGRIAGATHAVFGCGLR